MKHPRIRFFLALIAGGLCLKAAAWGGAARAQEGAAPGEPAVTAAPEEQGAKGFSPSLEPDAASAPEAPAEGKPLLGLVKGGGVGRKVLLVEVKGVIDLGLAPFIIRQLKGAAPYDAVILEIDTPGGRVDAALQIRDALIESKVKTVAFIHPRAISAGALIAYACDVIAISIGGTMGAATPITIGPGGSAGAVDEKMISYFRAEMASTARAKGRRGDIAEAMVDRDIAIDGVIEAGKLLTLDTDNALRLKVADLQADSLGELLGELGLEGAGADRPRIGWAEQVARWLTHPVLSGLLMSIGILGILIELYHPGYAAPGIVGGACLVLFFFGHLVVHLAGWEEVLLACVGVALLLVEVLAAPGHILPGVLGVMCIVAAFTLAMTSLPLHVSFSTGLLRVALVRTIISLVASIGAFIGLIQLLPRFKFSHPIIDKTVLSGTGEALAGTKAGDAGVADSMLRPSGRARLGGVVLDVITDGEFVEAGARVEVIRVEGGKIVVKEKA